MKLSANRFLFCWYSNCQNVVAGRTDAQARKNAISCVTPRDAESRAMIVAEKRGWRLVHPATALCPTCAAKLTEQGK